MYFYALIEHSAYVLTEELAQRELEGPPNPLALSEIISNALPPDLSCSLKKELKPNDFMVSDFLVGSHQLSMKLSHFLEFKWKC